MKLSNCCGARTTEPDINNMATCLDCHEGCIAEEENEGEFEEMAMGAMKEIGLEEDEAEAMLEEYNN